MTIPTLLDTGLTLTKESKSFIVQMWYGLLIFGAIGVHLIFAHYITAGILIGVSLGYVGYIYHLIFIDFNSESSDLIDGNNQMKSDLSKNEEKSYIA